MKISLFLLLISLGLFSSCQQPSSSTIKKGMIKVSVLYPNNEGTTFDMDYYVNTHFPMVVKAIGPDLKSYAIDKVLATGSADAPVPYHAIGYLYFDTLEAFQKAMQENGEKFTNDRPNYSNSEPIVLISEVIQ